LKWLRLAFLFVAHGHWERPDVTDPDGGGCYGRPAELGGLALGVIPGAAGWELWINDHWLAL